MKLTRSDLESSVLDRWARVARDTPDAPALLDDARTWSFRELDARARAIAEDVIRRTPPGPGIVAHRLAERADAAVATLGILLAGKTSLALDPAWPDAACRARVEDLAPPWIVEHAPDTDAHPPSPAATADPGDDAILFHTSGSTGDPKAVRKSHRAILHRAWYFHEETGAAPGDRVSLLTSPAYASAEADLFGAWLNGACLCPFDPAGRGLGAMRDWIRACDITVWHPPVVLFRRFLEELDAQDRFPSVRVVALSGETVRRADVEKWRRHFGGVLLHRFSTTETGVLAVARITPDADATDDFLFAGRPVPDKELALNDTGELLVTSRFMASGYAGRTPCDFHGRFNTKDHARILPDGRVLHLGRSDRQVKIRGHRVELAEIENAIRGQPAIREVMVAVDEDGGEISLTASVTLQPGAKTSEAELRDSLRRTLPDWKIPARIQILSDLPLTPTGKPDRRPVRTNAGPAGDRIAAIWRDVLKRADIRPDDHFFSVGGNSLTALVMLHRVSRQLGAPFEPADLMRHPTLRAFIGFAEAKSQPSRGLVSPIRPGLAGLPIYLAHHPTGTVLWARHLLDGLAPDRPIFALVPPRNGEAPEPMSSLTKLADRHADELIRRHPDGDFALLGYSFTGRLAYEIACRVAERGTRAKWVGIIDIEPEPRRYSPKTLFGPWLVALPHFVANLPWFLWDHLLKLDAPSRRQRLRTKWNGLRRVVAGALGFGHRDFWDALRASDAMRDLPPEQRACWEQMLPAIRDYRPGPYPGRVHLFRVRARQLLRPVPHDYGWSRYARGGVVVHRIPGADHDQLPEPPYAATLAAAIESALRAG